MIPKKNTTTDQLPLNKTKNTSLKTPTKKSNTLTINSLTSPKKNSKVSSLDSNQNKLNNQTTYVPILDQPSVIHHLLIVNHACNLLLISSNVLMLISNQFVVLVQLHQPHQTSPTSIGELLNLSKMSKIKDNVDLVGLSLLLLQLNLPPKSSEEVLQETTLNNNQLIVQDHTETTDVTVV